MSHTCHERKYKMSFPLLTALWEDQSSCRSRNVFISKYKPNEPGLLYKWTMFHSLESHQMSDADPAVMMSSCLFWKWNMIEFPALIMIIIIILPVFCPLWISEPLQLRHRKSSHVRTRQMQFIFLIYQTNPPRSRHHFTIATNQRLFGSIWNFEKLL